MARAMDRGEPGRERAVVLELKTEVVVFVKDDWDEDMVNFFFNESSHCIGTEFREIMKRADERHRCPCLRTQSKYLRGATMDEVEDWLGEESGDA